MIDGSLSKGGSQDRSALYNVLLSWKDAECLAISSQITVESGTSGKIC